MSSYPLPMHEFHPGVDTGDGRTRPPLLMLHGIHDSGASYANYLEFFSAAGFDCYAITHKGHGPHGNRDDLINASLNDYVAEARALHAHTGPAVIMGASMGGLLAQKLAELDEPLAVILLAPAPPGGVAFFPGIMPILHHIKMLPSILFKKTYMPDWNNTRRYVLNAMPADEQRAQFERTGPESTRAIRDTALGRITADASKVTCPMLIVVGERDPGLPPALQVKVARKYGAELWVLPHHSHQLTEERWWRGTAEKILRWLTHLDNEHGPCPAA